MKSVYKLTIAAWILAFNFSAVFGQSHIGIIANGSNEYFPDGHTASLRCNVTEVTVDFDDKDLGLNGKVDWNVSNNFTYTRNNEFSHIIYLRLDSNREPGYITATFKGRQTTIYIQQKPTPTLTVTPALCTQGQSGNFAATLNFYGPGSANVIWETTGGITVNGSNYYKVNDNTISSATIQHNSYGTLKVYGELPGCEYIRTNSAIYHIGTPTASDVTFNSGVNSPDPGFRLCTNQTYAFQSTLNLPGSQYSYSWSTPVGERPGYFYGSGPNVSLASSSPTGFVLEMAVTNLSCNTTGTTSRTFQVVDCNNSYRVASNPTSDNVTALFDPVEDKKYLPDVLRLTHEKSGFVKEVKVKQNSTDEAAKNGLKIDIDVRELPKDVYYLQSIYEDGKVQSIRVVVQ